MDPLQKASRNISPDDIQVSQQTDLPIVDQEAYEELQKILVHPILTTKQHYTASDGVTYSLGQIHTMLLKKIEHLPQEEQTKMMKLKEVHYQIKAKKMNLLKKAYGNFSTKPKNAITSPLEARKLEIIELFGRMFTIAEVQRVCIEKFKFKKLSKDELITFRAKHLDAITQKLEVFKREFTDLRLAIKKGRLEELVILYGDRKKIYEITKKADDHRLLLATLQQIKGEAEVDTLRIEGDFNVNIDAVIRNQAEQEILKTINIKEIVLARIAARANVPVKMFLGQIERSWYNRIFTEETTEEAEFEEIKSPSAQTYDFDRIAQINAQRETTKQLEISNIEKSETLSDQMKDKGVSLKEAILLKIKEKQGELNYAKNTIYNKLEIE